MFNCNKRKKIDHADDDRWSELTMNYYTFFNDFKPAPPPTLHFYTKVGYYYKDGTMIRIFTQILDVRYKYTVKYIIYYEIVKLI